MTQEEKQEILNYSKEWILNHFLCDGYSCPLYYRGILYKPKNIAEDFIKDLNEKMKKL